MSYCRLFNHFIWTTKNRESWIRPEIEPILFFAIRSKAIGLGGRVPALNAGVDHVHLVAMVPPKVSISKFIGEVKGISSLRINEARILPKPIHWQAEYRVLSLGERGLDSCISYVERQKIHHASELGEPEQLRW